jgi:DNA-binding CsgD family transcriptional regulator
MFRSVSGRQKPARSTKAAGKLSERQTEILVLLARGEAYKSIASRLSLSPGTVSYHVGRLQQIFQTRSLPALIALAIISGILSNDQWPVVATGQLFFGIDLGD